MVGTADGPERLPRTLRDPHDAEDAFQATFLILVKNGGAIRGRDALGPWLHRVAHRVANQANAAAARERCRLERQAGEMALATSKNGPAAPPRMICCRLCTRRSPGCPAGGCA